MKNEVNAKESTINLEVEYEFSESFLYQVIVHNDDFTPMEFVVGILEKFFYMDRRKAAQIMQEAHINGKAVCGMFSKDLAETKISQVVDYSRLHEHPLLCSMEIA
jgi:ATP-dependent Clp protease adaptor protein ClpS